MIAGLGLTLYYMGINAAPVRAALGLDGSGLWFGIQPISAGVFGVLAGMVTTVLVSFLPRSPEVSVGLYRRVGRDGI